MRPRLLFIVSLFLIHSAQAELQPRTPAPEPPPKETTPAKPLKEAEVDKLLNQLQEIDSSLKGKRNSYNASLLPRLKEAGNNDDKAFALWLEATREQDFEAQGKTATEFSDFRNGKGKELRTNASFTTQLRLQCRFLALVILQADASGDTDQLAVVQGAGAYLDDYVASAKRLEGHHEELNRGALETVIARHLKMDVSARSEKGPAAYTPGNIGEIYQNMILPYYREKKAVSAINSAWNKQIEQERTMVEITKVPERLEKFQRERLPELKWSQARDLFDAGQEEPAATTMVGLIKANLGHRSTAGWISELADLVKKPRSGTEVTTP